jgi:hypothetical protein
VAEFGGTSSWLTNSSGDQGPCRPVRSLSFLAPKFPSADQGARRFATVIAETRARDRDGSTVLPLAAATTEIMDDYDDARLAFIADFPERLNAANERLIGRQAATDRQGR